MVEDFIVVLASQRVRERGFSRYRLSHRDLSIAPNEKREVRAYNEIWFLVHAGEGILISSDYGEYDHDNGASGENIHEHGDIITITNGSATVKQAKFIQVQLQG